MAPTLGRRATLLTLLASLAACNSLVGIEPLQDYREDAAVPSSPGATGELASSSGGRAEAGPSGAGGGRSGAAAGDTAAGGAGAGAVKAGAGSGGDTAASGTGSGSMGNMGKSVQGVVTDARGRPVRGAVVSVGSEQTSTTEVGGFRLDAVPDRYDLTVVLRANDLSGRDAQHTWLFRGLQRRDPRLEVYPGPDTQAARLEVVADGVAGELAADELIYCAFGGGDADFQTVPSRKSAIEFLSASWSGDATTQGTVHALLARTDGAAETVTGVLGHDARPAALRAGATTKLNIDLSLPVSAGMASARVKGHGGRRRNWAVLRWADGAALTLPSSSSGDMFTLTVPAIADATVSLVALEGNIETPPYAVAYSDVAVGAAVDLTVPTTPTLSSPGEAASLESNVLFRWSGTEKAVSVLRVSATESNDEVFVVTADTSTTAPLASNTKYRWRIEVHGGASSVDEASGPSGFVGQFWRDALHGPKRGAGTFAASESRSFTTTP